MVNLELSNEELETIWVALDSMEMEYGITVGDNGQGLGHTSPENVEKYRIAAQRGEELLERVRNLREACK